MYDYTGHTDCESPLGVVVHQPDGGAVRLPVVNDGLQFHERKVGPTAITRRAEVTIPIEGVGDSNWTRHVTAFTPTESEPLPRVLPQAFRGDDGDFPSEQPAPAIQTADVIGHPIDDSGETVGEPVVLFRGYVAAVGSREGTNRARFRIYDPMKFLTRIEAGMSFNRATVQDVLRAIRDAYVDGQRVFTDVVIDTDGETIGQRRAFEPILEDPSLSDIELFGVPDKGQYEYQFSTNRDTLADVVAWIQKIGNVRVWFQPSGDRGLALTAVQDDAAEYDLTPESNDPPFVIQNNALYEMRPLTSLRLKGNAGATIPLGDWKVNTPFGDTYPEATATYPPLVERFGGELTQTTTETVTDTDDAEQTAAKQLKEALDEVSGGSMTTTIAPMLRPFDRVVATPACAGVTANVDPLSYEIQEAVHSVVPSDDNLPRTELSVSMSVDPDLIETESSVKDARTGDSPTDNDPLEEFQWGYGPGAP
ncbi:hypothetical protein GJ633_08160 [Halorubrum sp. CBA1125]|uniref:hypothetical protein n=1 Tax=Halorubrum sp. CBA1125 TaxID=2668072 RepID=UPI0012E85474|nr:hypothetical protein [Halorubrum sp. CBA1125]MUW14643.1 hypothetical protein [Halorubrum sp. CBA1125]